MNYTFFDLENLINNTNDTNDILSYSYSLYDVSPISLIDIDESLHERFLIDLELEILESETIFILKNKEDYMKCIHSIEQNNITEWKQLLLSLNIISIQQVPSDILYRIIHLGRLSFLHTIINLEGLEGYEFSTPIVSPENRIIQLYYNDFRSTDFRSTDFKSIDFRSTDFKSTDFKSEEKTKIPYFEEGINSIEEYEYYKDLYITLNHPTKQNKQNKQMNELFSTLESSNIITQNKCFDKIKCLELACIYKLISPIYLLLLFTLLKDSIPNYSVSDYLKTVLYTFCQQCSKDKTQHYTYFLHDINSCISFYSQNKSK